jgi:hypothetical protein
MLTLRKASTFLCALAIVAACTGCSGSAAGPIDEATARSVLTRALDAWAAGTAPATLRTETPELVVVDQQWTDGAKLVDYELVGLGEFDGKTLRAPVNLTVAEPRSRTPKKMTTSFTVGLQPVATVVRVME